jgi:MoaA/NifB/PqqE/SkfB family radical SAM enzyme
LHLLKPTYRRLYQGLNFRLRTFAGGRYAHACRPTSIAILLTERCNARCIHCDIWKNKGSEKAVELKTWKKLLSDLRDWLGPVHIVLSGGEALLKRFTIDLVEYGSSLGLFIELLTHGYWDDQSKFVRLALAKPGRVTFSFDGIGDTHSLIRGRDHFFEKTSNSIQTLNRVKKGHYLDFAIRLKTVVMDQNLNDLCKVAEYAALHGLEVFYQPIEQNYNTEEDPRWFEKSNTWPKKSDRAVAAVEDLIRLKERGLPIANSMGQLKAMIPYFQDPAKWRLATQMHSAHERSLLCSALTTLQIQADGGVTTCAMQPVIGNLLEKPIRELWESRPQWWVQDCCLERRS